MKMNKNQILIEKAIDGSLSLDEQKEYQKLLQSDSAHERS